MLNSLKYYEGYREFKHTYTLYGKEKTKVYLVHRDGTITAKSTGRPMKRIIRKTVSKATGKKYYQVQVRFPEKFYNWARVVAAAWFDYFDINDSNQLVVQRNKKPFDFRPINLYVVDKIQHLSQSRKVLTSSEQKAILWLKEKEKLSNRKIAKMYGVEHKTIGRVIRGEY